MDRARDTTTITAGQDGKLAKHKLFASANFFADVYVLRPGQAQSPHAHAREDKCYHVLSGQAVVTSGDRTYEAGPGTIVWCPAGEDHGVSNPSGPDDVRLLVFMAPHPG
ncbi:MAG: cupin domain-containing protein [Planctomycetota bacterium]|nr:cupin domain-containing protein [Planctomycetota bacterium]